MMRDDKIVCPLLEIINILLHNQYLLCSPNNNLIRKQWYRVKWLHNSMFGPNVNNNAVLNLRACVSEWSSVAATTLSPATTVVRTPTYSAAPAASHLPAREDVHLRAACRKQESPRAPSPTHHPGRTKPRDGGEAMRERNFGRSRNFHQ
jgi:hypothetical protein